MFTFYRILQKQLLFSKFMMFIVTKSKRATEYVPFGSQANVSSPKFVWINAPEDPIPTVGYHSAFFMTLGERSFSPFLVNWMKISYSTKCLPLGVNPCEVSTYGVLQYGVSQNDVIQMEFF